MGCLYVDREKKGASTNNLTSATANPVSSINGANQVRGKGRMGKGGGVREEGRGKEGSTGMGSAQLASLHRALMAGYTVEEGAAAAARAGSSAGSCRGSRTACGACWRCI
jgi:hypothetical protein